MSLAIIIPSKTITNVTACVRAIHDHESGHRLVIVDDGLALDPWPEILDGSTMIKGVRPFIFSRAVNMGIEAAGDVDGYILLNDDALLRTPGGFTKLKAFADAHPEVGCVAPSCNVTGQRLQWQRNRTPEGFRYVDTVPYICVYIPRRTLDKVGLLDERYCIDYGVEDLDHTTAMQRAGLKVAILYDVFVDHGSLVSSFRGDPKTPKSFQKNYALYKAKWGIR